MHNVLFLPVQKEGKCLLAWNLPCGRQSTRGRYKHEPKIIGRDSLQTWADRYPQRTGGGRTDQATACVLPRPAVSTPTEASSFQLAHSRRNPSRSPYSPVQRNQHSTARQARVFKLLVNCYPLQSMKPVKPTQPSVLI